MTLQHISSILRISLLGLIFCTTAGCSGKEPAKHEPDSQVVLLISIDGFRHDYIGLTETPAFDRILASGVQAESLIPVFPTKTFPNHYSIVTGLYPEHHGIVANSMWDSVFQESFFIGSGSAPAQDGKWYEGEPIWVTVEKQNKTAATFFWPGSDAAIQGIRPSDYVVFDGSIPYEQRVDQVMVWLDETPGSRPDFISLYFESVDSRGHSHGPASAAALAAVRNVDGQIGRLLDHIRSAGLGEVVNVIVVSDHGMSQLSRDRVIFLDDYIDPQDATIINWSPFTDLIPNEGKEAMILAALRGAHPHYEVYAKEEIPGALHYRDHYRINPVIGIADDGWSVSTRAYFDTHPEAFTGGNHGYRPEHQSMHGILLATGPAFKQGATIGSVESIHIYALMCHLLQVDPAPNDGDLETVADMLK